MGINRINKAMVNGLGNAMQSPKKNRIKKRNITSVSDLAKARAEDIIRKAIEFEDINPALVEKARALIASDQLETTKNIESAVRKILKYGF